MQTLIADKNILFRISQFRSRINILRINVMSLKNNLHKLYSPLQAFANHKLTPEIMNVKDLKATLDIVNDSIKFHLKLKLPVDHNSENI